jgi:hypothetical protein
MSDDEPRNVISLAAHREAKQAQTADLPGQSYARFFADCERGYVADAAVHHVEADGEQLVGLGLLSERVLVCTPEQAEWIAMELIRHAAALRK